MTTYSSGTLTVLFQPRLINLPAKTSYYIRTSLSLVPRTGRLLHSDVDILFTCRQDNYFFHNSGSKVQSNCSLLDLEIPRHYSSSKCLTGYPSLEGGGHGQFWQSILAIWQLPFAIFLGQLPKLIAKVAKIDYQNCQN